MTLAEFFSDLLPTREEFFGAIPPDATITDDDVIVVPLTMKQIETIYDLMEAENEHD